MKHINDLFESVLDDSDIVFGKVENELSVKKIRKKFEFILRIIADENNFMKEPYVKHFSVERYKSLYELRLKALGTMVRIIFYNVENNIILLNAFIK